MQLGPTKQGLANQDRKLCSTVVVTVHQSILELLDIVNSHMRRIMSVGISLKNSMKARVIKMWQVAGGTG